MYENGAIVPTSFCTNLGDSTIAAESNPDLYERVNAACEKYRDSLVKHIPKYKYPNEVLTAAMLGYLSHHGERFVVHRDECVPISALDSQKKAGKAIYGKGLLLSEKAAAEKAAATAWPLSDREKKIIKDLGD